MRLSTSPDILNFLINHSEIYPNITKDGDPDYLDATALLEKPGTYFFSGDGIGLLFWGIDDNIYEADIYVLPRKRGAAAKTAARQALAYMFGDVGAEKIAARIPAFNKPSLYMTSGLGFNKTGVSRNCWPKNAVMYDEFYYELERSWAV